jgi:threonine/homoserine/homoserine lactone efflux protein
MGQAIGQILPLAVGVALSPIPIVGVVLMLGTSRARSNGPAFIAGWIAGLAIVGTVVLVVSSGADASSQGQPANWVNVLKLVLGALLLLVAIRQWRGRPRGDDPARLPGWMRSIDRFTAGRAAAFGIVLSAVNPKNLLLVVAAAAAIAQTGVSAGRQAVALAVFIVIGTIGTGTPVVLYFAMGDRSKRILDDLKSWMSANNAAIMAVICLVIAAKLIGDGISGLST